MQIVVSRIPQKSLQCERGGGGRTAKKSTVLSKSLLEVWFDIVCTLHLLNQSLSERDRERTNKDKERDERKKPRNDKYFVEYSVLEKTWRRYLANTFSLREKPDGFSFETRHVLTAAFPQLRGT